MALIPATILTGFLGSGKTTLLKRVLTEAHGQKIAVIENEFGDENIDNDILVQDSKEQIVQLNNGCVCCTIREDLRSTLSDLAEKKRKGELDFDRVVIETTGLADPGPVAQTFFMDDEILHLVIDTAHSRFPVYEGERENIIGILLAKDLLKLQRAPELNLRTLLRPAVFVPESKGLNELLRDFRSNRNHLALVVDEFGSTAGLLTIEDVLEEIVGEIEDEFDEKDGESGIFTLADGSHRVAGDTEIAAVNEAFGARLPEEDFDTIGGLVSHEMGRVPRRGESATLGGLRFTVMLTRGGAVRWFKVTRAPEEALGSDGA